MWVYFVGREGIIIYVPTSHPSKQKNLIPYKFVVDSSSMTLNKLMFRTFKTNYVVKSTLKSNLWVAYYLRAFMLDECEVCSDTTIPSLSFPSSVKWGTVDILDISLSPDSGIQKALWLGKRRRGMKYGTYIHRPHPNPKDAKLTLCIKPKRLGPSQFPSLEGKCF